MLVKSLNPRFNAFIFLIIITIVLYFNTLLLFRYNHGSQNDLIDEVVEEETKIEVLKMLSSNLRSLSPIKNCKTFWKEISQMNITPYNDTDFDPENTDPLLKARVNWEIQNNTALIGTYNHCFIDQDECDLELEKKIYPWFTFKSPVISAGPQSGKKDLFKKFKCMKDIKPILKGKGIVLTATEFHFKELASLFTLLRALGTNLPLQIVHRGELSNFVQQSLIRVATVEFDENVKLVLGANKADKFPKLKIEFIDVSNTILPKHEYKFKRFQNKLLAYLFNSFKEVILMDVDSVPFIPLQEFFNFDEYKTTGAFFFKDRQMHVAHKMKDTIDFFESLLPTSIENEKLNIPRATKHTLSNRFFSGFAHMMESGLVIVDRSRHFSNPLMAISLAQWPNAVLTRVWGDKELYWLAMSISGDENYTFNKHGAGAVGEISKTSNSHYPDQPGLNELCSNHPSHLYKDNSLLWINTGFRYCKKIMHTDQDNPFFKDWKMEDAHAYNSAPLKIRQAVIPPLPKTPGRLTYFIEDKPIYPWESKPYCEAYTVCAYDKIDDQVGIVVNYSEKETQWFDYLGRVYTKAMDILISNSNSENKLKFNY